MNPRFRGLSKAIIDSPLTLSTLETLTFLSPWDYSIPLAGILAELEELSLSDASALQKIRIDLDCSDMSTRSKLLKRLEEIDNKVHWAGFPRLWSLEVNIDVPYIGVEDVPEESKRAAIIEDLENGIRNKFRRIKDREGMEVLITVYFKGKRPGGEVFNPNHLLGSIYRTINPYHPYLTLIPYHSLFADSSVYIFPPADSPFR